MDVGDTLATIERTLEKFKSPALMVSFGKDSMALIHLLSHLKLPVICHRQPFQAKKWEFADRIIREMNLTVYDWPPQMVALQEKEGNLELVSAYTIGADKVIGIRQRIVDNYKTGICGLNDCLRRPRGTIGHPWDLLVCAQKQGDTDHFGGHHDITLDLQLNLGGASFYFPFRDWTDDDVWNYLRRERVPVNLDRYDSKDLLKQQQADVDVVEGCFACVKRGNPDRVQCPRLNFLEVNNISGQAPYIDADVTI